MIVTNIYRIVAVVMLAGLAIHRYATVHTPPSVRRYHDHIRGVASDVPRIDGWVGEDVRVPVQAITVLRPNVMVSRRYINVENGISAGLTLVHCSDAHAMAGHFPLRCYPAAGWDVVSSQPRDWNIGDLRITGTEYQFANEELGAARNSRSIVVANCLFRPGGKILRDMEGMTQSIVGAGGQSSGAGQIQIYFDARVPREQRDAAVAALMSGFRPVIDAILKNPLN